MHQVAVGEARIDGGPTIMTMRWVFDALFRDAGADLDAHVTLKPATVLARHAWSGNERLDLFADVERSADAIGALAGAGGGAGLSRLRRRVGRHLPGRCATPSSRATAAAWWA